MVQNTQRLFARLLTHRASASLSSHASRLALSPTTPAAVSPIQLLIFALSPRARTGKGPLWTARFSRHPFADSSKYKQLAVYLTASML